MTDVESDIGKYIPAMVKYKSSNVRPVGEKLVLSNEIKEIEKIEEHKDE